MNVPALRVARMILIGRRLAHCPCLENHREGPGLHGCQAALTRQGVAS